MVACLAAYRIAPHQLEHFVCEHVVISFGQIWLSAAFDGHWYNRLGTGMEVVVRDTRKVAVAQLIAIELADIHLVYS